jgi:hypothetical protein
MKIKLETKFNKFFEKIRKGKAPTKSDVKMLKDVNKHIDKINLGGSK